MKWIDEKSTGTIFICKVSYYYDFITNTVKWVSTILKVNYKRLRTRGLSILRLNTNTGLLLPYRLGNLLCVCRLFSSRHVSRSVRCRWALEVHLPKTSCIRHGQQSRCRCRYIAASTLVLWCQLPSLPCHSCPTPITRCRRRVGALWHVMKVTTACFNAEFQAEGEEPILSACFLLLVLAP